MVLHPNQSQSRLRTVAQILILPAAIAIVALCTSSVREQMGLVNVALALAILTTISAMIDWKSGIIASFTAGLTLNYFHTAPVHSFRITAPGDIWMISLLTALGLFTSLMTAIRVRKVLQQHLSEQTNDISHSLLTRLFENRPVAEVWHESVDSLCSELTLVDVRIDVTPDLPLPVIARHKTSDQQLSPQPVVVLPECGAVVEFSNPAIRSHLVLTPRAGMGSVSIPRSVVFAFVDQIEQTL